MSDVAYMRIWGLPSITALCFRVITCFSLLGQFDPGHCSQPAGMSALVANLTHPFSYSYCQSLAQMHLDEYDVPDLRAGTRIALANHTYAVSF